MIIVFPKDMNRDPVANEIRESCEDRGIKVPFYNKDSILTGKGKGAREREAAAAKRAAENK